MDLTENEHNLMIEIFKCQLKAAFLKPFHLVGKFVYTYELDLRGSLGTPISSDKLRTYVAKFLKAEGFDEFNSKKFFGQICRFDVKSERLGLAGKSTRFYLINPLHKLDEDDHDD